MRPLEAYAHVNIRAWREHESQPYGFIECKVAVAPSNVAGLGVYAKVDIKADEIVCVYSGECVKCVSGNTSSFVLECKSINKDTGKHETWFIDSRERRNGAGRYINDACDLYGGLTDVPEAFKTPFGTNVRYKEFVSQTQHDVIGKYYVQVEAMRDIDKGEELFAMYGAGYWKRYQKYKVGEDPEIVVGRKYEQELSQV